MEGTILKKIRRLNWVLSESTTGSLSYSDLSGILSEIVNANVLITDISGKVLGSGYTNVEDSSTIEDELGNEKLTDFHRDTFLTVDATIENLIGEETAPILGENYGNTDKYHCIVPIFCGGERMGTMIVARYDSVFDEVDIALCEYGSTVVGIEIKRNNNLAMEAAKRLMDGVDIAIQSLSYTEKEALSKIMGEIEGDEGNIIVSKIAGTHSITNSVVVNALRKLESAGVLRSRSLGMKGTYIKITNPYFREKVETMVI